MNVCKFCLNHLISPSYLNEILGFRFGSLIILRLCYHLLLAWRVSIEIAAAILKGIQLYDIFVFPFAALNTCFLCLNFQCLIKIFVVWCFTVGSACLGLSSVLVLRKLFPSPFNRDSQHLSLQKFSHAYPHTLPPFFNFFGLLHLDTYDSHGRAFYIVPEFSNIFLLSFLFFCTPTVFHLFPSFYLHLISSFSVSVILRLLSFKVLLISLKSLIIITWLFFISSRSTVKRFISSQFRCPVYLLVTSFNFQDLGHRCYHYSELFFGKSSYLLFFCLLWWLFIVYLHCLHISLFLFCLDCCGLGILSEAGGLWLHSAVEPDLCGWDWTHKLSRFIAWVLLCLWSVRWSWIISLWSAISCPVMCFVVYLGLVWFRAAPFILFTFVFLLCWTIGVGCLALQLLVSDGNVGMETFGCASLLVFTGVRRSTMI